MLWPSLKAGRTTAGLRSDACVCFAPVVGNPIRLVREANSRVSVDAEILVLRHQLNIQRRHVPKKKTCSAMDRLIIVGLYRLVPNAIRR